MIARISGQVPADFLKCVRVQIGRYRVAICIAGGCEDSVAHNMYCYENWSFVAEKVHMSRSEELFRSVENPTLINHPPEVVVKVKTKMNAKEKGKIKNK